MLFSQLFHWSFAHRDGCHRWHTCPSDTGSYVCGDLGHGCGSSDEEDTDDQEEDTEPADDDPRRGDEGNDNEDNDSKGGGKETGSLFGSNNNDDEFIDNDNNPDNSPVPSSECQGQADCFSGIVTEIVDGDTLDVNNVRIRLTLVNTPERGESGYQEARVH